MPSLAAEPFGRTSFRHLPGYARFLLEYHLRDFCVFALQISRELNMPLLRFFEGMPEEQLLAMSIESNSSLFHAIIEGRAAEHVAQSTLAWQQNRLPVIQGTDVVIEDISKANFVRRQSFRHFLKNYSSDLGLYVAIMEEADQLTLIQEEISYKTLFEIKEDKIREHHQVSERREQQLREAQEIAGMGSFEWNLCGGASAFSKQLLHIFEMEEHSNLADFLAYVHPADRESVKAAIADALAGHQDYECEYRYRKSKAEKIIWSRGKVIFEDGKPALMKGTVMDVTQRHDMLKRLARSEALHKQAQALTHFGNWSWSLLDNTVEWSDEMYRIFGLEPHSEEMTLGRILSLIHPDDRDDRRQALYHALNTKAADDYIMRVLPPGGDMKYVEGKSEVLSDEEGKPYKIAGTCQDITRQYLLNERLKENEEASRQLINNAPEAIVVIDMDNKILLWNPKAETTFGWSLEEIQGRKLTETIIPPAFRNAHQEGMERLHATGKPRILNKTVEVEALKKSGETFFISLTVSRSIQAGRVVYIAFIRDVTDEKATALKLEEQRKLLAQKNTALERSNQELTAFNYIASHDLAEPVRKIKLFSDIILKSTDAASMPPKLHDAMLRIESSAGHMERLIEALVMFSRANADQPGFEDVDLTNVLRTVIQRQSERIAELNALVTNTKLPVVKGIAFQLQQLFENIVSNALKYRQQNVQPRIQIDASIVFGNEIEAAGAHPAMQYHLITIADNGIGFEQQFASKVFEVFQRLHTRADYAGTGIGLAICKKVVQQHNGFITVQSSPGEGTTFSIYLPATEEGLARSNAR